MALIANQTNPQSQPAKLCLLFVIQAACRHGEARQMTYDEFRWKQINSPVDWGDGDPDGDPDSGNDGWDVVDWDELERGSTKTIVWFLPKEHTKTGKARRVPMNSECIKTLREARPLRQKLGTDLVFPSYRRPHGIIGRSTLSAMCDRLELGGTPHGCRTSFRNWCEHVGVSDNAAEISIGHELSQVKRAYLRSLLLAQRSLVMEYWAQYLRGKLSDDWKMTGPTDHELAERVLNMGESIVALTTQVAALTTQVGTLTKMLADAEERARDAEKRLAARDLQEREMQPALAL